ncbi:MAG: hypothetical protein PHN69_02265 [Candidatus Pacebacteria bacterium]|nr:hypothetical protein [Candidatus Paceibacterota bacterium]
MDNQNNSIDSNSQNIPSVRANIEHIFSGDSYGLFVFKKTERIVTAIYLLTGLMSDSEPMKSRLREIATELISNALNMSERVWGEEFFQKGIYNNISEISVLFNIAETTKMVSKMNHDILVSELQKLSNFLTTSSSNYSSAKIAFSPNIFSGDYNYVPDKSYKNNSLDIQDSLDMKSQDLYKGQKDIKDIEKDNVLNKMSPMKISDGEKNIKDKNNRQDIIKSMLKSGVKLTIKDFAKNIKGCSEKTIQRELISMVSSGVLKKEGERRWSKYFLA